MEGRIRMQTGPSGGGLCTFSCRTVESPEKPSVCAEARFLLVRSGAGRITVQGRGYSLRTGDSLALLPWQVTEIVEVNQPLRMDRITYPPDVLNRLLQSFYGEEGRGVPWQSAIGETPVVHPSRRQFAALDRLFLIVRDEVDDPSALHEPMHKPFASVLVMNAIAELAVRFARMAAGNAPAADAREEAPDDAEILRYIYTHCSEKLTLKRLSGVFYRSESSISAYITGATGLSFFDLLNEMRVGRTANYLLYTDFTVEELAKILGYVDASHLSKVFLARTGARIGEYRRTYRNVAEILREDDSRRAYAAVEYIYRNYREPLTVSDVAERFQMRAPELQRILRAQVERSFDDFLHLVRIDRASELLLTTSLSVLEIALEVGYNNVKTFTRNFAALRSTTPQTFRKTARDGA